MSKTRELKCMTCGERWREPMRPGARPWECPKCNPPAARRREAERERAAKRTLDEFDTLVNVPDFMLDVVRSIVELTSDFPTPSRSDLARQIRLVAHARGHLETKRELMRLSALCASWAAWLPDTQSLPERVEAA